MNAASSAPPAERQATQVIIDFPQVGVAGPFPVVDGRVSLPDSTMRDLVRMLRSTYEAEQQAAKVAPAIGDELRDTLVAVSAAIAERDDRAAQKMIREILEASPTLPAEQQAAPKAAQGVGNSGFDHKTAADFLNGKTVSDEAVRNFVAAARWAHDEKASLSAMLLSVRGELASREAEIALLKNALLEAEAAPQPAPAPAPLSERDAFERDWEKRHAPVPINGRTHDDGRYGDSSIQDAWESWQARAALAAQGGKDA